ncbi:MAG: bifunctional (p)ppGpp synthetase/guanosine-3',5'-bis(diphosphate) 3'-pyrophosphohydrolase [Candidatus Nealsonbacteria bacterium]|nr:bifunctional (p)ppGpp synthetase/guanosine-3',5'-bis(diphosphate) 3'-pyrophosphohydrolase [Candidatus Nealsonbacteria bacterium]
MSTPNIIQKILRAAPEQKLAQKALEFARAAHLGQKRRSGEDYINHPIKVAETLRQMGLDQQTIAAGFLHDVVDDTNKTPDDIENEFGKEVAFLVAGVSKLGKLRYPKTGLEIKTMEERVEEPIDPRAENLRKMFFAMGEDLRVVLIKLADRLHNMETLESLPPEKQKRISLETLEVFVPLADRLGIGEMRGKLQDLAFPYLYPKEYDWLTINVRERYEKRKSYSQAVQPVLKHLLAQEGIKILDMHSRAKSYWSLYQKLLKNEMNIDKIYDLVALRIIVKDVASCYKALGIIHKHWRPLPQKIQDFIALPRPNGYQGLHTTVFCLEGKLTEFQIKTKEMHDEAENGICAHWAYKQGIDLASQKDKFAWVAQLRDWPEVVETLKIDFFKNRIFVFTPKGDVIDLPEGATPVDFAYSVHTDIGNKCAGAKVNGKMLALSQALKNGDVVEIVVDKNKKPSRDWLEFAKTSMARSRIKTFLKLKFEKQAPDKEVAPLPPKTRPELSIKPSVKGTRIALAGQKGMQVFLAKCCLPEAGRPIKAYITRSRGASVHQESCVNLVRAKQKWPYKVIEATWDE